MSVKQDRTYVRTAAELEQKHKFGKRFAELLGLINDSRDHVDEVESGLRNEITKEATAIRRDTQEIVTNATKELVKTTDFTQAVDSLGAEINSTNDAVAELGTGLDSANEAIGELDTRADSTDEAIEQLNITFEEYKQTAQSQLKQTADEITAKVESTETKVTKVEESISNINTDIEDISGSIDDINGTIGELDTQLNSTGESIEQITADLEGINTNIDAINTDIAGIGEDVEGINTDMEGVKADITTLQEYREESIAEFGVHAEQINASVTRTEEIYTEVSGAIEDTKTGLAEEVETRTRFQTDTESSLSLLSDSMELRFAKTESDIIEVNGKATTNETTLQKYFDFDENGLTIKAGENQIKLRINNDMIAFYNGEIDENDLEKNRFGMWDGEYFHTGNIIVKLNERAQFGNFAFVPRSNGSLDFLKVGE